MLIASLWRHWTLVTRHQGPDPAQATQVYSYTAPDILGVWTSDIGVKMTDEGCLV